jgi:hypothetical protein
MSTRINVNIGDGGLLDRNAQQQAAARQANQQRASADKAAAEGQRQLEQERIRKGLDPATGERLPSAGSSSRIQRIDQEPAANRRGLPALGFILGVREWWFGESTFNTTPRSSASLFDLVKITKIRLEGDGELVEYDTQSGGSNSTLQLLNGAQPFGTFFGFPFLPPGTTPPTSPYVALMDGPRLTVMPNLPGSAERDPANYIVQHPAQLVVVIDEIVYYYKPFFNIYKETVDPRTWSLATQPKLITPKGQVKARPSKNQGTTFNVNDSTLFDVNHAFLTGKRESGIVSIKPKGTDTQVHLFATSGLDRGGSYSLASSGDSRFSVGNLVYWQSYGLYTVLGSRVRYFGTIAEINRGTFTYDLDGGGTQSFTGLRIVIDLDLSVRFGFENTDNFLNFADFDILPAFTSIEAALSSPDTLWQDQFRNLGGFQNEWVVKTTDEVDLPLPSPAAAYIGQASLLDAKLDSTKAGKAYFIQSTSVIVDTPPWREQENYHDGDTVAQRPANTGNATEDESFRTRFLDIKFFELDCLTNKITKSATARAPVVLQNPPFTGNAFSVATAQAMPEWFPSKRYRVAGYTGGLNLNASETEASTIVSIFDSPTQKRIYFVRKWPLDQDLPIANIISMIQARQNFKDTQTELTDDDFGDESINIGEDQGPARWGYTYADGYYVAA